MQKKKIMNPFGIYGEDGHHRVVLAELMAEGMSKEEAIFFLADMDNLDGRTARRLGYRNDRNPNDPEDFAPEAHDDRNRRLKQPHYTEERYRHAQTVFGKWSEGIGYDYDDRIPGWYGWEEWEAGQKKATEHGLTPLSVAWYEFAMSWCYESTKDDFQPVNIDPETWKEIERDPPIRIEHVLAGFNWSNGYPYFVFGYRNRKRSKSKKGHRD